MIRRRTTLLDIQATLDLGKSIAKSCLRTTVIYLYGDLGVGKTTLSRGFLQTLGYHGHVKSPTYTLVESYVLNNIVVHHFDLYRIIDSEELEFLGVGDYITSDAILLIEWPQKGKKALPKADIVISLYYYREYRKAYIIALSKLGESSLTYFISDTVLTKNE